MKIGAKNGALNTISEEKLPNNLRLKQEPFQYNSINTKNEVNLKKTFDIISIEHPAYGY